MTAFLALVAKELRALFVSPIAYAVIAVFLVLNGYGFAVTLFATKQATLVNVFFQAAVQLVLFVPLVTMRQFAEERRGGTLELLLTAPVREGDIVLAKFAASMGMLLAMVALTLVYAGVLARFSTPDWGPIYSGYLGLVLLAGALVSIGLAVSALTANQIVAAVVSLGVFGMLWAIDAWAGVAAVADRRLGARAVAAGALPALRRRRHVRLGFRLLPRRDPARAVPRRARAGPALTPWSTPSSTGTRCSGLAAGSAPS